LGRVVHIGVLSADISANMASKCDGGIRSWAGAIAGEDADMESPETEPDPCDVAALGLLEACSKQTTTQPCSCRPGAVEPPSVFHLYRFEECLMPFTSVVGNPRPDIPALSSAVFSILLILSQSTGGASSITRPFCHFLNYFTYIS
jgi:hypothetical protein